MNRFGGNLMTKLGVLSFVCHFAAASVASAAVQNVPDGVTGLWRFEVNDVNTGDATMKRTIGANMINSNPGPNGNWFTAPSIQIGTPNNPFQFQDSGVAQVRSFDWLTAPHGISPNGGGSYVNEYTILWDWRQTTGVGTQWSSFYQTAAAAHANDGDFFSDPNGHVGIGAVGYSTQTHNPGQWNRIVLSVDNGNFFRAYVNGVLFLDGAGQPVDGRFSLEPFVHLLADDNFEDEWGLLGTAMIWDHALTTAEVAGMGGYEEDQSVETGNPFPTPLILGIPEPASMVLLGLGLGCLAATRRRK